MHEIHASQGALVPIQLWPPDDSEESIIGTDLHQMTIINLRWGLNKIAVSRRDAAGPVPWQALGQTIVTGFARPNGSRYKVLPDLFVYRQTIDRHCGSVPLSVDGPSVLIVEV